MVEIKDKVIDLEALKVVFEALNHMKMDANKIFIGTLTEYQIALVEGEILENTIVILTDDVDASLSALGTGQLGQLILF